MVFLSNWVIPVRVLWRWTKALHFVKICSGLGYWLKLMEERCWEVCKLWWGSYVVPFNCCGRSCHRHHRWCWATLGRSLRLGQTWKGTHTLLWEWGLWVCNSKKGKSYVVLNWMIFCSFQMPNKEISKVQISFTFHLLSATKLIISDCPINSYFEGTKDWV